jgi:DNA-directed RNA polymerase specialized sigma24 family protein
MPKQKRGTDWRGPGYEKCKWQAEQLWQDSDAPAYLAYWKPRIEDVAVRMVTDYTLPTSCMDDLISNGLLALAQVPPANRWSGKYVYMAIINRMRRGLKQAKTRWSRFELWGEIPESHHPVAPDGINDRLTLESLVVQLDGDQLTATRMQLAGCTEDEIATFLSVTVKQAKEILAAAVETMRKRIKRGVLIGGTQQES